MTSQDQCREAFEVWWTEHGQPCRAGGGDYEKTFAFRAWQAARPAPSAPVELPEPAAWLIERSAFRVSPHGQDAESNEWLEEAHKPGEEGSFRVYTEQQVRELLAHRGGRTESDHPQTRMDAQSEAVAKALPAGWVAVPVEPTEAMRSVVINESDIYQSPDALYAALLAAALKLLHGEAPAPLSRHAVIQHLTSAGVIEQDGCGLFIAAGNASELINAYMQLQQEQGA